MKSFLVVLLLVAQISKNYTSETRHNVLLILIDDMRPLEDKNVNLTNIQKMAAKGYSFKNAFAQQALCAPSRNSMLTGRRPDTLHLYDFYSYWRRTVGNFTTLPQFFKQNGYDTYSVGKIFHPGPSSNNNDDYPYSWSLPPYHPPTDKYKDAAVCKSENSKRLHKNLICPIEVIDQPGGTLPDKESLNYAIRILKKHKYSNNPFFLAVGFHKPHIPLKFPNYYLSRVPIETVEPPTHPKMPKNMPLVAWQPWTDLRKRYDIEKLDIPFPMGLMPKKWSIKIRQAYYAAAAYIDSLIGKLTKHINMNNTVIVLTSDHGWSLGENGLWAKYSNFDAALRVPLIFRAPGLPHGISNRAVELIDVFPTVVELAGLPNDIPTCKLMDKSPLCFQGKSLTHLMTTKRKRAKFLDIDDYYALSQYPRPSIHPQVDTEKPRLRQIQIMGYSIRTKRYRYTEWISFNHKHFTRDWNTTYGIELYDHLKDPEESNNLYLEKKHCIHIKMRLSSLLRSLVEPS